MNIAIVGTGISGLSIAKMLNKEHQITLFERLKAPGGLIKCERVQDCLFHKVGGHVFNAKDETVLNWFWSHFDRDREFVSTKRKAKVFFNNAIIGYPIENYIYLLDKPTIKKITGELLELQKETVRSPFDYENFETFLKGSFGQTLFDIYFKPYNEKIWRTDLKGVSMDWLEGKLPMPNIKDVFDSNILREEEDNMVHSYFYYPKENGSQFIVDRLRKDLNIISDSEITDIKFVNDKIVLQDGKNYDKLVFCGDVRKLPQSCKQLLAQNGIDISYLENLKSNGTSNLFCETDSFDISWLYIPQNFTKAHRIIYTGNFSESNNRGSKRKTCVVEFSGKVDYDVMVEEIKRLPGNLTPISFNYEQNSYVIQDAKTRPVIKAAKKVLKEKEIYLLGRFAEWEYYNMDKAIEAAFKLKEELALS